MLFTSIRNRSINSDRSLVVLYIDETLLHASTRKLELRLDYRAGSIFVYKRPHIDRFFILLSANFFG